MRQISRLLLNNLVEGFAVFYQPQVRPCDGFHGFTPALQVHHLGQEMLVSLSVCQILLPCLFSSSLELVQVKYVFITKP